MAAVHAHRNRSAHLGRDQGKRGIADDLRLPGNAKCPRDSQTDADPGETAGAQRDTDFVGAALVGQFGDHRHQPFGMAATQHLVPGID
jgi:hypothetical protein